MTQATRDQIKALLKEAAVIRALAIEELPASSNKKPPANFLETIALPGLFDEAAKKTPVHLKELFHCFFRRVLALPYPESEFLVQSAWAASINKGTVERYAKTSAPHVYIMPAVMDAMKAGLILLDSERAEDIPFRHFYLAAKDFSLNMFIATIMDSDHKAYEEAVASGRQERDPQSERVTREDYPRHQNTCRESKERVQALFPMLTERHKLLMNHALRNQEFLINTLRSGLSLEEGKRIETARIMPFRNGTRDIDALMQELHTDDAAAMYDAARYIAMASDVWPFSGSKNLLTMSVDDKGRIDSIEAPQAPAPTVQ